MGADTKALLKVVIDPVQIANDLIELYGTDRDDVNIRFTCFDDYYKIEFYHRNRPSYLAYSRDEVKSWLGNNTRQMSVHYGCTSDYRDITTDDCTYLSLGCWGESVEIMECLLRKYGGWIIRNDSTDDWEEFIN